MGKLVGYCAGCGRGVCESGGRETLRDGKLVYHDECFLAAPLPEKRVPRGKREGSYRGGRPPTHPVSGDELRALMSLSNESGGKIVKLTPR